MEQDFETFPFYKSYKPKDAQSLNGTSSLDPNHNIFLLVDDGTEGSFGGEPRFRADFEACVNRVFGVPVVTIVIQGGIGTLDTAYSAVLAETPLVVIDGSGQAADILAYAWNFTHSTDAKYSTYTVNGLEELIERSFPHMKPEARTAAMQKVFNIVRRREKVRVKAGCCRENLGQPAITTLRARPGRNLTFAHGRRVSFFPAGGGLQLCRRQWPRH